MREIKGIFSPDRGEEARGLGRNSVLQVFFELFSFLVGDSSSTGLGGWVGRRGGGGWVPRGSGGEKAYLDGSCPVPKMDAVPKSSHGFRWQNNIQPNNELGYLVPRPTRIREQ